MDNQVWFEEFGEDHGDDIQQETPEDTDSQLKWDIWHSGYWRIDMNRPRERDIEIEPVPIHQGPLSDNPFHIRFYELLSDEEVKKYLRAIESWIDEGGLDAIRS